jgi:hypothetical protein
LAVVVAVGAVSEFHSELVEMEMLSRRSTDYFHVWTHYVSKKFSGGLFETTYFSSKFVECNTDATDCKKSQLKCK